MSVETVKQKTFSVKVQVLATVFALISAVLIPQAVHVMGAISGTGTSLGEMLLPMHLPIIFVGLLVGPFAGALSGFFAPLISFALTGMPMAVMLPFMMIELGVYGLSAGLLKDVKFPTIGKVLLSQIAGRALRAVAILLAIYAFGYDGVGVASIWMSIPEGIFGIALQLILIPLLLYRVKDLSGNEK